MGDLVPLDDLGLSGNHQCDRCGARAYSAARRVGCATLLFCGHHTAKYFDRLVQDGWVIEDQRSRITEPVPVEQTTG